MQSDFAAVPTHTGRAVTLALSGELDLVSSPALTGTISDLAGSSGLELIIVDLRGLVFMDSTGLHAVIQAQQEVQEAGQRFALIRGPEQVQRLFELTGVADALTIVDSPERLLEVDQAPGAP
jgi:anti-sigma B factor antagonist